MVKKPSFHRVGPKDANLRSRDLVGLYFRGTNLEGVDLSFSDCSKSDFHKVNFAGANLTRANFTDANLQTSDLNLANLKFTEFIGAILPSNVIVTARIGSRKTKTTAVYNAEKRTITIFCGCWKGSITEFDARVQKVHGDNKYAKEYLLAIKQIRETFVERFKERAYHFYGDCLRDGSRVPNRDEWLVHTAPIKLCSSGLHASFIPTDAMGYAPGPNMALVDVAGDMIQGEDKLVCTHRRIVKSMDVTNTVLTFVRTKIKELLPHWEECPDIVTEYFNSYDPELLPLVYDATGGNKEYPTHQGSIKDVVLSAVYTLARPTYREWANAHDTMWHIARAITVINMVPRMATYRDYKVQRLKLIAELNTILQEAIDNVN